VEDWGKWRIWSKADDQRIWWIGVSRETFLGSIPGGEGLDLTGSTREEIVWLLS